MGRETGILPGILTGSGLKKPKRLDSFGSKSDKIYIYPSG
jgi:hypothetical protein